MLYGDEDGGVACVVGLMELSVLESARALGFVFQGLGGLGVNSLVVMLVMVCVREINGLGFEYRCGGLGECEQRCVG